ncbi:aminopeptidase P N-terminal domain-containing protein, partial [Shewanella sp. AS1]|uniref:aminopeptidase P N-terminal domain-containing protein n=1 Tax=Shewanella sp. AS1 TaxID=2907626 RepID=UPI001F466D4B
GLNKPGLYAIIDIESGNDYIFGDDFTIDSIVWMGPQPTIKEMALSVGVERTGTVAQLSEKLNTYSKGTVNYLPPYRPEHQLKLMRFLGISPAESHA